MTQKATEVSQGEIVEERRVTQTHQGTIFTGKFVSLDATPSVYDVDKWECGAGVVVITNFDDGQNGQVLKILGNVNTTIANNANIKTNTAANKVLVATKIYTFTRINNVWYEDE